VYASDEKFMNGWEDSKERSMY